MAPTRLAFFANDAATHNKSRMKDIGRTFGAKEKIPENSTRFRGFLFFRRKVFVAHGSPWTSTPTDQTKPHHCHIALKPVGAGALDSPPNSHRFRGFLFFTRSVSARQTPDAFAKSGRKRAATLRSKAPSRSARPDTGMSDLGTAEKSDRPTQIAVRT